MSARTKPPGAGEPRSAYGTERARAGQAIKGPDPPRPSGNRRPEGQGGLALRSGSGRAPRAPVERGPVGRTPRTRLPALSPGRADGAPASTGRSGAFAQTAGASSRAARSPTVGDAPPRTARQAASMTAPNPTTAISPPMGGRKLTAPTAARPTIAAR